MIVTGSDQWYRKKKPTKTSSTGELKDGREANTSINGTIGHTMLMSHKASPRIWIITGKTMTVIKSLVFIRARGGIEAIFF